MKKIDVSAPDRLLQSCLSLDYVSDDLLICTYMYIIYNYMYQLC